MFWLIAAIMVLVTLALMVPVLLRRNPNLAKAAELDLQVYKDQLEEVERDVARGVLPHEDAKAVRLEVSRRILAADKRSQLEEVAQGAGRGMNIGLSLVIAAFLVVGSYGLYVSLGVPNLPDQPLAGRIEAAKQARDNRPNQEMAEASAPPLEREVAPEYVELVEKLRDVLKTRQNDVNGFRLLANHEARLGNFTDARLAQQRVLDILGDKAGEQDFTDLAEIMVVAAGGYVSPQAEQALALAIRLDPKSHRARYYSGLTLAQNGRPDIAYRMWQGLLDEGPKDAPWIPLIQAQIGSVARAAGISVANSDAPGPTSEDVKNAQEMSEEERQDMIRTMVAGLSERLASEGGSPSEWARLIRAYGVLGETGKANTTWTEAKEKFDGDPKALKLLHEAARAAEVSR